MTKMISLLATTAVAVVVGYSHGTTETMLVTMGKSKNPVRVNVTDFDEKTMKKYTGAGENEATNDGTASDVNVTGQGEGGEVITTAAPSAPNFGSPDAPALPTDPVKNAVAPAGTTADQLLVMKSTKGATKGKFVIADGMGVPITGDRAKLLKIDEAGYDTEQAASEVVSTTEPRPTP